MRDSRLSFLGGDMAANRWRSKDGATAAHHGNGGVMGRGGVEPPTANKA
jgi:hypothetical protein